MQEQEQQTSIPRVTALIVSHNNAENLRRCLAALEASEDRPSLEILVVDKGSRDESARIDAEFPNVTMLRLPRNFGTTKALNIGVRTSSAELLLLLAPEVGVEPQTVNALVHALEADPDAVAVCPLLRPPQTFYRLPSPDTGDRLESVAVPQDGPPAPVEWAPFQAMLVRKYFIKGLNYFDEHYGEFWADAELGQQIRRAGRKLLVVPAIQAHRLPAPAAPSHPALESDRRVGLAAFFSKHYGFGAGLLYRIKSIAGALFGFQFPLLLNLFSGQKIDGTQSGY